MEKAHGAVFCLRFSRIGTLGLAFSLLLPFIELLVLGLCFSNLSFSSISFLGYLRCSGYLKPHKGCVGCRTSKEPLHGVMGMTMAQDYGSLSFYTTCGYSTAFDLVKIL
jgi:hypothetical protein